MFEFFSSISTAVDRVLVSVLLLHCHSYWCVGGGGRTRQWVNEVHITVKGIYDRCNGLIYDFGFHLDFRGKMRYRFYSLGNVVSLIY